MLADHDVVVVKYWKAEAKSSFSGHKCVDGTKLDPNFSARSEDERMHLDLVLNVLILTLF